MLSWPLTIKIYLGAEPTDMKKGFDSLAYLVESSMAIDPFSGHRFLLRSHRGDWIQILYWDVNGYVLWYKRLEKRSFQFPTAVAKVTSHVGIKAADLAMILDEVDLVNGRR
jgi:transposase